MANSIGQAYVQILPTTKDFGSNLARELSGDSGVEKSGKSLGGKLIKGLTMAGIGTAIVKGISSSVKAGGELQQSIGGIEALFGKSADKVKANASRAFETVGISANRYMEQVTSFSASLIQGLNGDTKKATAIADMAMQDMGDNVNRFGTSAEMVQNAYQGFAKGNFTMLDNLKLGYGGTKTEMLRLVKDAGVVDKSVKSIDDVTFDQMIEGIHKVQENLNVTGTTAKEASTTLQGSLASLKAVGQDLLGNLGIGADITPQLEALLSTAETFLTQNLFPMVSNVITGLANNAGQLAISALGIFEGIVKTLMDSAPQLVTAGLTLITELGKGLVQSLPTLIPQVYKVIAEMAKTLTDPTSLSEMLTTAVDLLVALADGIDKAIPVVVGVLPVVVDNIVQTLIKSAPKLIPAATNLIMTLACTLISLIPQIVLAIGKIIQKMIQTFKETNWSKIGDDIINGVVRGVESAKEKLLAKLRALGRKIAQTFKDVLKIGSPSKVMADLGKWIPIGLAVGIEKNTKFVSTAIDDMIHSAPLLSGNMTVSAQTSGYKAVDLYEAVRKGASEARPVVLLNNRVLSRELKGMGVSFA